MAKELKLTGYELSRDWFNFCFDNPELIKPSHSAMYFFAIEHCNRLGWKIKFGFPTEMVKDAIGIKNYKTFSKTFEDLVEWGFFHVEERSKNQYSSNVISLAKKIKSHTKSLDNAMVKNTKARTKSKSNALVKNTNANKSNTENAMVKNTNALIKEPDNAMVKNTNAHTKASPTHIPKQVQRTVVIDKPINKEPINLLTESKEKKNSHSNDLEKKEEKNTPVNFLKNSNLFREPNIPSFENVHRVFLQNGGNKEMAETFFNSYNAVGWFKNGSPIINFSNLVPSYVQNWKKNEFKKQSLNKTQKGFHEVPENFDYDNAKMR